MHPVDRHHPTIRRHADACLRSIGRHPSAGRDPHNRRVATALDAVHPNLVSPGAPSRILRDALCTDDADPAGVYFGNRNGEVFASADDGDSWRQLASHLPDVLCVRAAVIG